jgi:PAS domain S-box-containing protein
VAEGSVGAVETGWAANSALPVAAILEKIPVPVLCADTDGRIVFINDQFEKSFGYTLAHISQVEDWWQLAYPDERYRAEIRSQWLTTVRGIDRHRTIPIHASVSCLNGMVRHVQAHVAKIGGASHSMLYIVCFTDFNHARTRIELQEDVQDSFRADARARAAFVSTLTHELRTPLNAIIGFSEFMLHHVGDLNTTTDSVRYLSDILASGRQLWQIVNGLLEFMNLEAGQIAAQLDEVIVQNALQSAVRAVEPQALAAGVSLSLEVAPDIRAWSDEPLFRRIVAALLTNAVKFSRSGGTISVTADAVTRVPGRRLIDIAIRDTGIGMSEDELALALTPFRQVNASLAARKQGLGLGLLVARRLAEITGGYLELESVRGVGTTVHFYQLTMPEPGRANLSPGGHRPETNLSPAAAAAGE